MDLRMFCCPECRAVLAVEADVADDQETLMCPQCEAEIDTEHDIWVGR